MKTFYKPYALAVLHDPLSSMVTIMTDLVEGGWRCQAFPLWIADLGNYRCNRFGATENPKSIWTLCAIKLKPHSTLAFIVGDSNVSRGSILVATVGLAIFIKIHPDWRMLYDRAEGGKSRWGKLRKI